MRSAWIERAAWLLAIAGLLLLWWLLPRPGEPPAAQHVPAAVAPEVKTVERVIERPKIVYVYPDKAKDAMELPAPLRADAAEKLVSASRVEPDRYPHTITTTLNLDTGQFSTLDRREQLPWLARDTSGEVGVIYGFKNGAPATRLEVRQNLIAVKAATIGLHSTLDQDGDWYAGAGVWLRW